MAIDLSKIITISLFAATFRMTTPVLLATLGGIFSSQTGIFYVGLEGLLMIGAFFGVLGSVQTGSPWGGLLYAIAVCVIANLVFAVIHLELKANEIIAGLALNIFAIGLTLFLITAVFHAYGFYQSPDIIGFNIVEIPLIKDIPILGPLFSGHFLLVYIAFFFTFLTSIILNRTPIGFHMRAVGERVEAAETVGVSPKKMKYIGFILCGILCGMGGAFLSLAYLNVFAQGMSAGRGWLALAAINFGDMKPGKSLIACLIFGFVDALSISLQQVGLPSQFVQMLPYIVTIIVLGATAIRQESRKKALAVVASAS